MKFALKQNCFLVKFLVPLKERSRPDNSFPHFNYCKCFLRASNLPWMQQSILRTRTDEQLTHLNWKERRKERWNWEKSLQWKWAQPLVVSWYPCLFLFPSALFCLSSLMCPSSCFIWKLADSRSSLGSASAALVSSCKALLLFCWGNIPALLTECFSM